MFVAHIPDIECGHLSYGKPNQTTCMTQNWTRPVLLHQLLLVNIDDLQVFTTGVVYTDKYNSLL